MAFVFGNSSEDELYPFLGDDSDTPLSPDDQAILLGMYPGANLSDFDFPLVGPHGIQQHLAASSHPHQQQNGHSHQHQHVQQPSGLDMNGSPSAMDFSAAVTPTRMAIERMELDAFPSFVDTSPYGTQAVSSPPPPPPSSASGASPTSGTYSPGSTPRSDAGIRDSEEILKAPVKSLTEEEKKLRRRAQVAKSARKHRNRQKEELSRLRDQVQYLQEQMAAMRVAGASSNGGDDAIAIHRKRKKVEEDEDCSAIKDDLTLESALVDGTKFADAAKRALGNSVMPSSSRIQHWFHHLPVDTLERTKLLPHIVSKRMQHVRQYLFAAFGSRDVQYPHMDIKLNSNGPDMEVQVIRAKATPGFTHTEVSEAAWASIYNFDLKIPTRFKPYVTCERLMELDENTRYGRSIIPLLKNRDGQVVYMHSFFVVHRVVNADSVMMMWESIDVDDLYPMPQSDTALRNDEVGCSIMETERLPNGQVRTLARTVIHSTPPIAAISEPQGRLNEAFLTVLCRNADVLETSARLHMRKQFPEREIHTDFEYIKS